MRRKINDHDDKKRVCSDEGEECNNTDEHDLSRVVKIHKLIL